MIDHISLTSLFILQLWVILIYRCLMLLVGYLFKHVAIIPLFLTCLLVCIHVNMHVHHSFILHAHYLTRSLRVFWLPWICASRYMMLCSIDQVFDDRIVMRRLEFFICWFLVLLHLLHSYYFLIYSLSCVDAYMWYCSDVIHYSRFV